METLRAGICYSKTHPAGCSGPTRTAPGRPLALPIGQALAKVRVS
jgi:hypothetical protein